MTTESVNAAGDPDALAGCLVRTQQMLLAAGYRYIEGDEQRWPLTFVQMIKRDSILVIGPFAPADLGALCEFWTHARAQYAGRYCGLMLVGDHPTDDPAVRGLFEGTRGSAAYLDARRGQFRLRRGGLFNSDALKPMHKANIKQFLSGRVDAKARQIDCRNELIRHLQELRQEQEFHAQARLVAGKPVAVYALLIACIGVFLAMLLAAGGQVLQTPSAGVLLNWGADYGPLVKQGQWWRVLSCSFVHIGVMHLLFNMMAMYYFGAPLEVFQGKWRLAFFYFFSVVTASLASLWWDPMRVSAGASGGLFGMVGAMLALVIRYRRDFPPKVWLAMRKWVVTVLGYNAIFFFMPMVDGAAHVGGFVGGLAIGLVLSRSPLRISWPRAWAWAALAAMVFGVLALGDYTVGRIKPGDPLEILSGRQELPTRQRLVLLEMLNASHAANDQIVLPVRAIIIEAQAIPDPGQRNAQAAQVRAIIATLEKDNWPAQIAEKLAQDSPTIIGSARELDQARLEFCRKTLDYLGGKATLEEARFAHQKYLTAQTLFGDWIKPAVGTQTRPE